jgi:arsenate reductase
MSNITIYHNPACGTSRNVLALIRNSGEEPTVIEYLKTPPTRETLVKLIAAMGVPRARCCARKARPMRSWAWPTRNGRRSVARFMRAASHPDEPAHRGHAAGHALCRPSETVLDILPNPQRGAFNKEDGEAVVDAKGPRV